MLLLTAIQSRDLQDQVFTPAGGKIKPLYYPVPEVTLKPDLISLIGGVFNFPTG